MFKLSVTILLVANIFIIVTRSSNFNFMTFHGEVVKNVDNDSLVWGTAEERVLLTSTFHDSEPGGTRATLGDAVLTTPSSVILTVFIQTSWLQFS